MTGRTEYDCPPGVFSVPPSRAQPRNSSVNFSSYTKPMAVYFWIHLHGHVHILVIGCIAAWVG